LETEVAGYISERKAPHSIWYPVCYAEGIKCKYLHSTNHLGYDASLCCNSRNTMMQDRLTGLALMNFHHEIPCS